MRPVLARLASLALLFGVVSCGASSPVRDRVKSGQWEEACRELARWREEQQTTLSNPDDMSEHDVASELAERLPVEVHVRALPAMDVEKRTGLLAGSSLRLAPFDPRLFGPMFEISKMPPADPFDRDWMVIERTVKVGASAVAAVDVSMALEERSPAARDPNQPWAPRWIYASPWTAWEAPAGKARPEDDLARALGLSREGGTSAPTLWSMFDLHVLVLSGSLIDPKTRGQAPLLFSKTITGRQPSAEEQAAVRQLLALTAAPPCRAVKPGGSCTDRILLRRANPSSINTVRFSVSYVFGGGDGACHVGDARWAALPPARTVGEQLAAVFGKGGRSLQDLARRESVFQSSSDEVLEGEAASQPVADCGSSAVCSLQGRCQSQGDQCAARTADCEGTPNCLLLGHCVARDGQCAPPAGAAEGCEHACAWWGGCAKSSGACWADAHAHCTDSIACKRFGACQLDLHTCAPGTTADCQASEACRERGFCALQDRKCLAATDADCASSEVCRSGGACRASGGLCVAAAK